MKTSSVGRGCLALFGLPFAAVGVGAYLGVLFYLMNFIRMQSWAVVPATVETYRLEENTDSDGVRTYKPVATYTYHFQGRQLSGSKVSIADMADNFGSHQADLGKVIEAHWKSGQPIDCYVNPTNPAEAALDRALRYELLVFVAVFAFFFGGIGIPLVAGPLLISNADPDARTAKNDWPESTGVALAAAGYVGVLGLILLVPLPLALGEGAYISGGIGALMIFGLALLFRLCLKAWSQAKRFGRSTFHIATATAEKITGTLTTERSEQSASLLLKVKGSLLEDTNSEEGPNILCEPELEVSGRPAGGRGLSIPISLVPTRELAETTLQRATEWKLEIASSDPARDYRAMFRISLKKEEK